MDEEMLLRAVVFVFGRADMRLCTTAVFLGALLVHCKHLWAVYGVDDVFNNVY